jgi:superfamily II DNA/RNA helicase
MQHTLNARPNHPASPGTRDDGFAASGVSPAIVEALAMRGIPTPFAIQSLVLPDAIAGRDILARSRTGSGKTLAFAIPIVERINPRDGSPTALVLVPTRELVTQVIEEFRVIADIRRLRVAPVYGGVAIGAQSKRSRGADVIVATPGRLLDLVSRRMLRLDHVELCVLDEADRMLDMGFLPDVTRILEMLRPDRQTMLFSATLDGEVGRLAARFTTSPVSHEVADEAPVIDDAVHRFVSVEHPRKTDTLVRELAAERGLTLVFVRTQRGADRLAKTLLARGFRADRLHGGMSQPQRERALDRFATGRNDVLVATDVAARGLDLDGITHVINFDAPADEKAYVHRVGRTARAGRGGDGITFVTSEQRGEIGRMAGKLELHAEFAAAGMTVSRSSDPRPARPAQARRQRQRQRRR